MKQAPITLKELNQQIRAVIKTNFETYWLIAEISELSVNYSGHCYLEFIQKNEKTDKTEARIKATIWANVFRMIKPYFETTTGQAFSEGIKVMVRVVVEFHEIYGLSLNVIDIEPTYTVGEVALRKQKILEKLLKEGVIEMNKELELPYHFNRIAIISSKTAAGLGDFINQIENNSSGFKIYKKLFPAIMQGNEAEGSIINQLDKIFQNVHHFDAVVIIRGGGSQADLDCFNNYWLAYNVAQFPIPVLTGIGHEQDDSVVDVVAHSRLKTPTAVAEFIIDHLSEVEDDLLEIQQQIVAYSRDIISEKKNALKENAFHLKNYINELILSENKKLSRLTSNYISSVKTNLARKNNQLNSHYFLLREKSRMILNNNRNNLKTVNQKLSSVSNIILTRNKFIIEKAEQQILLNDPKIVLGKGYSITTYNGKSIKDGSQLRKGDEIETVFKKGKKKSIIK